MNFLRGRLAAAGGGAAAEVELEGQRIGSRRCPPALRPGEEVLAAVRTERVQLNPQRPAEHLLRGAVRRVVYRGTDYEVSCSCGAQEIRAVVSSASWDAGLREGAAVRIGLASQDVLLFPRGEESQIIHYSSEAV
jgi:hypothetical protein